MLNMKRLAKHVAYLDRCIAPLGDKNTAQQLVLMLENSLLNSDVTYTIEQVEVPGHRRLGVMFKFDCCDLNVSFNGCVVGVKAIRKYRYEVVSSNPETRREDRSEKLLREMTFNQMNNLGSQLHCVLRIMSNAYRLCAIVRDYKDSFTDALIKAYTQFSHGYVWTVPETIDYDEATGIQTIVFRNEINATLSGSNFELHTLTKHCALPITISTFGLGDDKYREIADTFSWYLKVSGLVGQLAEHESKSVDNIIDFNTGFNMREE